jgi:hypothetical protein
MSNLPLIIFILLSANSLCAQHGPSSYEIPLPIKNRRLYSDKGNLKTIIEFIGNSKNPSSIKHFDKKGNVRMTWYGKDSVYFDYLYDKNDSLLEVSRQYAITERNKYDKKGRLVLNESITPPYFMRITKDYILIKDKVNSAFQWHSDYKYTKYVINQKESKDTFLVYEVNLNRRLQPIRIRTIDTRWSKMQIRICNIIYNKEGNISTTESYLETERTKELHTQNFYYDNFFRLVKIKSTDYFHDNDTSSQKTLRLSEFQYYKDSSIIITHKNYYNGNLANTKINYVNSHGIIKRSYEINKSMYPNDSVPDFYEVYSDILFDEKGNWILFKNRLQSRYDEVIEKSSTRRIITYYD